MTINSSDYSGQFGIGSITSFVKKHIVLVVAVVVIVVVAVAVAIFVPAAIPAIISAASTAIAAVTRVAQTVSTAAPKVAPAATKGVTKAVETTRLPAAQVSPIVGNRAAQILIPRGTNEATAIGARLYSGHALDQMQGRGTTKYYDIINEIGVVLNEQEEVVTTFCKSK